MKKLIAMLLALVLVMGLVACGNTTAPATTPATTEAVEATEDTEETLETVPAADPNEATKVFTAIWEKVPEENRFFAMGGDTNEANMVNGAPGNYGLEDEGVNTVLLIPAEQAANVTELSSLMNAMMGNHFTGSVALLAEGADVAAYTAAMKDAIANAQWICGQPEKSLIAVIDGQYVLAAYGLNDNIVAFETALTAAYADAEIVSNDPIVG